MPKQPKLKEIAFRIDAHLKRLERDRVYNKRDPKYGTTKLYCAGACASGNRVIVRYVSYQGHTGMNRELALRYLAWLDAGKKGKHYGLEKKVTEEVTTRTPKES